MIPLYGFLEGDVVGLLVLADETDTAADLARKLVSAASVRVLPPRSPVVMVAGRRISPTATLEAAGLDALDRFDVVNGA